MFHGRVLSLPMTRRFVIAAMRMMGMLHRDLRLNGRMWIVVEKLEIFKLKAEDVFDVGVNLYCWQWAWVS